MSSPAFPVASLLTWFRAHARDLERKLAAVTKERDTLKRMIEEGITFQDIAETKPDAP